MFYPYRNCNSPTIEFWVWISNFIPHFTEHVITYPVKGAHAHSLLFVLCFIVMMTSWQRNSFRFSGRPFVRIHLPLVDTVYPKKYAHGFVVLCFVVVMQSFIMNSHEVFMHIHQGCFAGTGAIVRLPQCQRSKPDGYGKISQCITTTKHSKAKTVCIFLGIYCTPY